MRRRGGRGAHRLGTDSALVAIRALSAAQLPVLPAPLGFHPHRRGSTIRNRPFQHKMGPDPPAAVVGGVKPRINGEQHAPGTTRCSVGRQGVTSRQAATRLLRCAPALQVTRRNPLTRLVFMAGSELPAIADPIPRTRLSKMSTPTSCVRHLQALFRRRQQLRPRTACATSPSPPATCSTCTSPSPGSSGCPPSVRAPPPTAPSEPKSRAWCARPSNSRARHRRSAPPAQ